MSNIATISQDIYGARDSFATVLTDKSLNFEKEAGFALQVLQASDYALGVAMQNRQAVVDAITNIAAIGISLNPAKKQAYLVPRGGKICLDISYMGLMELAIATGSIRWGQARTVHEQDQFELIGLDKEPLHRFKPFSGQRGAIVGVYVTVKTADGDYLTDLMSVDEVNAIRDRSIAWDAWIKKQKSCPWVTDWAEMAKKTVVKRASKYWPKNDRLAEAIHHLNTEGGEGLAVLSSKPATGELADKWLAQVVTTESLEALQGVWLAGKTEMQAARDVASFQAFKAAVEKRKQALSAQPEPIEGEVETEHGAGD